MNLGGVWSSEQASLSLPSFPHLFHHLFEFCEGVLPATETQKFSGLFLIDELAFEANASVCHYFASVVHYFFLETAFEFLIEVALQSHLPVHPHLDLFGLTSVILVDEAVDSPLEVFAAFLVGSLEDL